MQQPPLLCRPFSLKLHICMGHRQQIAAHFALIWLLFLVASWHVDRAWLRSLVHTSCGPCRSGPKGGILPWSSIADLSPFQSSIPVIGFLVVVTKAPSHSAALPIYFILFYYAMVTEFCHRPSRSNFATVVTEFCHHCDRRY